MSHNKEINIHELVMIKFQQLAIFDKQITAGISVARYDSVW